MDVYRTFNLCNSRLTSSVCRCSGQRLLRPLPFVAPLVGGGVGAVIYDFTIHKALEARKLMASGSAEVKGEAVREPGESAGK